MLSFMSFLVQGLLCQYNLSDLITFTCAFCLLSHVKLSLLTKYSEKHVRQSDLLKMQTGSIFLALITL